MFDIACYYKAHSVAEAVALRDADGTAAGAALAQFDQGAGADCAGGLDRLAVDADLTALDHRLGKRAGLVEPRRPQELVQPDRIHPRMPYSGSRRAPAMPRRSNMTLASICASGLGRSIQPRK